MHEVPKWLNAYESIDRQRAATNDITDDTRSAIRISTCIYMARTQVAKTTAETPDSLLSDEIAVRIASIPTRIMSAANQCLSPSHRAPVQFIHRNGMLVRLCKSIVLLTFTVDQAAQANIKNQYPKTGFSQLLLKIGQSMDGMKMRLKYSMSTASVSAGGA